MTSDAHSWQLYICRACGLIYDEQAGDPDSGLPPGTRFEDIPDDWQCPLCGVGKADFELFHRPVAVNEATYSPPGTASEPGVVIVGAGAAGWAMAETLRQQGSRAPITMITACAGDIYHKPELSIAFGRNKKLQQLIKEPGARAAARLSITLIPHTHVVSISPQVKAVRSTRGTFPYEHLVLAIGAKNQLPPGVPAEMSWRVNHIDAWAGLEQCIGQSQRSIAIVGAGMVGCELAENLSCAGHQVKLIYRDQAPLKGLVPVQAGVRLQDYFSLQGIECLGNETVQQVHSLAQGESIGYKNYRLILGSGRVLDVDEIVTATGLKPDKRLADATGLSFDNGIVVNPENLQTSAAAIYALGDCISLNGQPCRFISPIIKQAQTIASQIMGEQLLPYSHQQPDIRLKVQSCALMLKGAPRALGEWQIMEQSQHTLTMQQWLDGEVTAWVELKAAS